MRNDATAEEIILRASCPAGSGIVAAITTFLADRGAYLSELSHFDDEVNNWLFLRTRFHIESGDADLGD